MQRHCAMSLFISTFIIHHIDNATSITFEKELCYNYSYFELKNLGTLVTSATDTINHLAQKVT